MAKKKKSNDFLHVGIDQLMTPTGKIITFNDEQLEGINKIRHWLKNGQTFFTLAGYAGTGKAQPLYSKLYTPDGYTTMGDVNVGDLVIGSNGEPTKVLDVYPQGIKPIYRVTFSDGFHVDCCEDHLWKVRTFKDRNRQRTYKFKYKKHREYYTILSTKEMLNNVIYIRNDKVKTTQFNYKIDINSPVKFNKKTLPINPYVLGVLIGDGGLTGGSIRFTSNDNEIIERVTNIINTEYDYLNVKRVSNTMVFSISKTKGRINKMLQIIKTLGLNVKSESKYIPEIYKYSSIEDRISLLQGLMDTDGTVDKNGYYISYATVSKRLAYDISELIQSLGCTAKIYHKTNNHQGCYLVSINQSNNFNMFSLTRKQSLVVNKTKYKTPRYISKIEYVGDTEQKCILVDAEDHLYLTDNFTITHNTTCVKKIIDEYRHNIVVSAPTHKAKKVLMNTTDMEAQTLHSLLGLRPDVDLDSFNPNDPEFAPIADPKIGNYDFVIIDEASMINQDLYNMIVEKTKDIETKVLFMGDPAQIPPVGEKESVVFSQQTNEFHQLTKIERQNESNPIFFVTDALRNNLTVPNGGFERISRTNKNGEGITFITDKQEFRNAILEKYTADEFRRNTDYAKVIAWRNKTVMGANKVIRTALFGENSDIIEVGDILMGYRSVRSSNARYNIIENSADYRVVAKSELEENKYKIMGWRVKIREDLPHGKFKFKEIFIVDISNHDNLHRYAELHDTYKEYGKKHKDIGGWSEYYNFRRQNILMKTILKYKDGKPRNKYDIIAKDMDYGMAITAHKCLSEDSWVQRNNGFVKLKDIKIGDVVCCGNNINEKVIDKIYTGKKRSFKLKTSLGYEIRCSEDHKILNIDGNFQSLINFNIGDYIPINRNKINDEINVYERDINYYMGLLVADGWYSGSNKRDKYRILLTISLDDGENIQFIKEFYKNNNINFGEYSYKNRKIINIGVSNKKWREYLQALGLEYVKGEEKSIPPSVLNGSLQQKSNFIAGLFDGDGSVNNKGLIRFVNNSYILIKQIQNILLEFGIISSYHEHKKSYTLSILYTSIPLFKKFISFRLSRKKDKLNNYIPTNKTNIDFVPFKNKIVSIIRSDLQKKNQWNMKNCGVFLCDHRKLSYFFRYKYISYYHLENIIQLYEINQIPVNSFIEKIYHNHYFYDKIVEIIEEKEIDMYDLEIENIHRYIADGFIVHNSQGSTYTHVFVMENDIDANWLIKERNQLKYTSFTRPTTSVTVLTNIENEKE